MKPVREALEALQSNQPLRAKVILSEHLGESTRYDLLHGHIMGSDDRCGASTCELRAPSGADIDPGAAPDWLEKTARRTECPTTTEAIEMSRPAYDVCPNCGTEAGFRTYCDCGFPME